MIINNIGNEIVFVGDIPLSPGRSINVADVVAQNPMIQVLVEHGKLELINKNERKKRIKIRDKSDNEKGVTNTGFATGSAKDAKPVSSKRSKKKAKTK